MHNHFFTTMLESFPLISHFCIRFAPHRAHTELKGPLTRRMAELWTKVAKKLDKSSLSGGRALSLRYLDAQPSNHVNARVYFNIIYDCSVW